MECGPGAPLARANLRPVLDCLYAGRLSFGAGLRRCTFAEGLDCSLRRRPGFALDPGWQLDTPHAVAKLARALKYELVEPAYKPQGADCVLAFGGRKGRVGSSVISARIHKLLRRSLGYHLSCDLYVCLSFFTSEDNPADDGTRGRETEASFLDSLSWRGRRTPFTPKFLISQSFTNLIMAMISTLPSSSNAWLTSLRRCRPRFRGFRRPSKDLPRAVRTEPDVGDWTRQPPYHLAGLPRRQFLPATGMLDFDWERGCSDAPR